MIEIDDLTVQFGGVRGLNALTARLAEPVTGLVGPNGAGKTTLDQRSVRLRTGLRPGASGSMAGTSKGIPLHKRAAFGIRRTFQNEQVVENLTAADNVAAVLDNVPGDGQPRRQSIEAALEFVGLAAERERARQRSQRLSAAHGRDRPRDRWRPASDHDG